MLLPNALSALQLAVRSAISAAVAVGIAGALNLEYPIYALVGAVIVTDLSAARTRALGWQRIAGTVLGALVGALWGDFLPPGPLMVGFGILVAMLLSQLVRLEGAAKVTGYVCGIVVLSYHEDPWTYSLFRLIETLLGIGVALLVSMVPKLIRIPEADES